MPRFVFTLDLNEGDVVEITKNGKIVAVGAKDISALQWTAESVQMAVDGGAAESEQPSNAGESAVQNEPEKAEHSGVAVPVTEPPKLVEPRLGFSYALVELVWQANGKKLGLGIKSDKHRVYISRVDPGSLADGTMCVGDRLMDVNGAPVSDMNVAKKMILAALMSAKQVSFVVEHPESEAAIAEAEAAVRAASAKAQQQASMQMDRGGSLVRLMNLPTVTHDGRDYFIGADVGFALYQDHATYRYHRLYKKINGALKLAPESDERRLLVQLDIINCHTSHPLLVPVDEAFKYVKERNCRKQKEAAPRIAAISKSPPPPPPHRATSHDPNGHHFNLSQMLSALDHFGYHHQFGYNYQFK